MEPILEPFSEMIEKNAFLYECEKITQQDFVYAILMLMAKQCGGFGYFWRGEDEDFVLDGWIEGLNKFRPKHILQTIDLILNGKYKKQEDIVPRNAMDFKYFMNNGPHAQLGVPRGMKSVYLEMSEQKLLTNCDQNKKEEENDVKNKEEKTREVYEASIETIRLVLNSAVMTNRRLVNSL